MPSEILNEKSNWGDMLHDRKDSFVLVLILANFTYRYILLLKNSSCNIAIYNVLQPCAVFEN